MSPFALVKCSGASSTGRRFGPCSCSGGLLFTTGRERRNLLWRGLVMGAMVDSRLVDPSADRAVYKQLADVIRAQIETGELEPGQRLPAQKDYIQEYGVSRDTVERAMDVLLNEGLIVTDRRGRRNRVRPRADVTVVPVSRGTVSARMPTEPERRRLGIGPGVPILIVTRDDRTDRQHQDQNGDQDQERDRQEDGEVYPADQVEIHAGTQLEIDSIHEGRRCG